MEIEFDRKKRDKTLKEHGLDFARANEREQTRYRNKLD